MEIYNGKYSINIRVNGRRVDEYNAEDHRVFVEAKDGTEYDIQLKNHTCNRVVAIVSVDGIDVVSGEKANPDSLGYIINGYESLVIKGYRVSDSEVGAFKFTSKGQSYAKHTTDSPANCGVISVRFVCEDAQPMVFGGVQIRGAQIPYIPNDDWYAIPTYPWWGVQQPTCDNIQYNDGSYVSDDISQTYSHCVKHEPMISMQQGINNCKLSANSFDMGTGWGSKKRSEVAHERFNRSDVVYQGDIYYTSRDSLNEMGLLDKRIKIEAPKGFCKPPPGWP